MFKSNKAKEKSDLSVALCGFKALMLFGVIYFYDASCPVFLSGRKKR